MKKIEFVQKKGILCCSILKRWWAGAARGGAAPVLGEEKYIQVNAEYKKKNDNRIWPKERNSVALKILKRDEDGAAPRGGGC